MRNGIRFVMVGCIVAAASLFVALPALADHSITLTPILSDLPTGWLVGCEDVLAETGNAFGCESGDVSAIFTATEAGFHFVHPSPNESPGIEAWGMFAVPVYADFHLTKVSLNNSTTDTETTYWINLSVISSSVEYSSVANSVEFGDRDAFCTVHCDVSAGDWIAVGVDLHYGITDETVSNVVITGTAADGVEAVDIFGAGPACGATCLYKPVRDEFILTTAQVNDTWGFQTQPGADIHSALTGVVADVVFKADGYTVTLGGDRGTVIYTGLGQVYVQEGDTVTGGCLLGQAQQTPDNPPTFLFGNATDDPDVDTWIESFSSTPCNSQNNTANCLTDNPGLDNGAEFWSVSGGSAYESTTDSAVDLSKGGTLSSRVTLDPETAYYITVIAAPLASKNSQLTATFGDETAVLDFSVASAGEFEIVESGALSPGTADRPPDGYDLVLTNTYINFNNLRVTFVCIHTGDIQVQPGACYFNTDGAISGDSWTTDGDVTFVRGTAFSLSADSYLVPEGSAIWRPVALQAFADADTDFMLTLTSTNPNPIVGAAPYGEWTIAIVDPENHATVVEDIGTLNVNNQIVWGTQVITLTLAQGTTAEGDLLITNTSNDIAAENWDLTISKACLSVEGGLWPGYGNADTSSDLLPVNCETCSAPPDWLNVAGWLQMVICTLRNLWFCYAAVLINAIWGAILGMMKGLGLLGRWLGAAISLLASWAWMGTGRMFSQFITWLIPIINTILAWLQSLPFVQSLIDTAGLAAVWFAGIWNFVVGVVNLFISAVRFIGVLFGVIGSSWAAFIAGLSHASEVTFSFPDCSDPETFLYDACLPFDVVNFMSTKVVAFSVLMIAIGVKIGWNEVRKAWNKIQEAFSG